MKVRTMLEAMVQLVVGALIFLSGIVYAEWWEYRHNRDRRNK